MDKRSKERKVSVMSSKIKSAKSVSDKTLLNVWEQISDKPLPDIYAYVLEDKAFLSTVESLQKHKGVVDTRVKEYGADFDNRLIEACTFEFKGHLIILVKKSANLADSLEHELRHAINWQ
jgi:hypothetical protein